MQQALSKFFIVKSIIYAILFSVFGYIFWTKMDSNNVSTIPIEQSLAMIESWAQANLCFEKSCFDIEIANDNSSRAYGLMNRTSLDADKWMLFVFDKDDVHSFWMKNTLISLDMIWINSGGVIVDIQTATPCLSDPCPNYIPSSPSRYVLELNAGISKIIGLQKGSLVSSIQKRE